MEWFLSSQAWQEEQFLQYGLYYDYWLLITCKLNPQHFDKTKKYLHLFFNGCGLKIIDHNIAAAYFLHVTINPNTCQYYTYHKLNLALRYIDLLSKHPENVINKTPHSDKQIFLLISKYSVILLHIVTVLFQNNVCNKKMCN